MKRVKDASPLAPCRPCTYEEWRTEQGKMLPLDPAIPHLVEMLRARIADDDEPTIHTKAMRLFGAIQRLPLTCKEAAALLRAEPLGKWLLFYMGVPETKACGGSGLYRLYDAVPSTINFYEEESRDDVGTVAYGNLEALKHSYDVPSILWGGLPVLGLFRMDSTLVKDRIAMHCQIDAGDAEGGRANVSNKWGLRADYEATEGLPENTPARVRQLVGFARFQMQLLVLSWVELDSPACGICKRNGCFRFAIADHYDSTHGSVDNPHRMDGALDYWEACAGRYPSGVSNTPTAFSTAGLAYCCGACERNSQDELVSNVRAGCSATLLNAIDFVRRTRKAAIKQPQTRGQIAHEAACQINPIPSARLYVAALDRNQILARRLAKHQSIDRPMHLPLWRGDVQSLRRQLIDAVNIDTALLYAASVLSELPATHRPKKKQPSTVTWRQELAAEVHYLKAITGIRKIYRAEQRALQNKGLDPELPIVTDASVRWMQTIKDEAIQLF